MKTYSLVSFLRNVHLMEYIKYLDTPFCSRHGKLMPTYEEIVGSIDSQEVGTGYVFPLTMTESCHVHQYNESRAGQSFLLHLLPGRVNA